MITPFQRIIATVLCAALFLSGLPRTAHAFARAEYSASRTHPATTSELGVSAPRENIVVGERLCGEQYTPDLGLYYLRARMMNPLTGRFWNMDSYQGVVRDPASLHKYLYVNADPVNGTDPSGHMNLTELAHSAAIVIPQYAARVGPAIAAGGGAMWKLYQAMGVYAQNLAYQVMSMYSSAIVGQQVAMGSRIIDFTMRIGARIAAIEVKWGLPWRAGDALNRLAGQVNAMVQWGQGQVVVWTLKFPTPEQLRLTQRALGENFGKVQFVHGVEGLYNWARFYFMVSE